MLKPSSKNRDVDAFINENRDIPNAANVAEFTERYLQEIVDQVNGKSFELLNLQGINTQGLKETILVEKDRLKQMIEKLLMTDDVMDAGDKPGDKPGLSDPFQIKRLIEEWVSVMYHHRQQKRQSINPVTRKKERYSVHLWGALEHLINNGFVEPRLATAVLAHDVLEDVDEVRDNITPFFIRFSNEEDVAEYYSEREGVIRKIVFGVTEPEIGEVIDGVVIKDKEQVKQELLKRFLRSSINGAESCIVRLVDRLHNMETLNSVPDEGKRQRKAKETLEVYAPLARRLGLTFMYEALVRLSMKYLNPDLIKQYDEYMQGRVHDVLEDVWEDAKNIWTALQHLVADFMEDQVTFAVHYYRDEIAEAMGSEAESTERKIGDYTISLVPHRFTRHFDKACSKTQVERLRFKDVIQREYADNDTVVDVVITTPKQRKAWDICAFLQMELPSREWRLKKRDGGFLTRSADTMFSSFGGKISIDIADRRSRMLDKRGAFRKAGDLSIPPAIQADIQNALRIAEGGQDIRVVIRNEKLLKSFRRFDIWYERKWIKMELPHDCTAGQLLCELVGKKNARLYTVSAARSNLNNEWTRGAVSLDSTSVLPADFCLHVRKNGDDIEDNE